MNYLVDSNIIIYTLQSQFAFLLDVIYDKLPAYSLISKVEVLGYHQLDPPDKTELSKIFAFLDAKALDLPIIEKAIQLRQQRRMTLGDSLVAATALHYQLTLITRNTKDFKWIDGISLFDPFDDPSFATKVVP